MKKIKYIAAEGLFMSFCCLCGCGNVGSPKNSLEISTDLSGYETSRPVSFQSETERTVFDIPDVVLEINQKTMENPLSGVRDLTEISAISAEEVKCDIEAYEISDKAYFDDHLRNVDDDQILLALRNLDGLTAPVNMRYGIIVKNSAVRAFPTSKRLSDGDGELDFDYLQESMLMTGEGVIAVHQTADAEWSFVLSSNYKGWVRSDTIGFCSREQLKCYTAGNLFGVVTAPKVQIGGQMLRMGTRIAMKSFDGTTAVLLVPERGGDGMITYNDVVWTDFSLLSVGYLDYTPENVIRQAEQLTGMPYGWGDTDENMDCSSSVNAIYRCFGFILPRNTSSLPAAGGQVVDLAGMGAEQKREEIRRHGPGTILLMPGHVVIYLGQRDGVDVIFHNVTRLSYDKEAPQNVLQAVITPLDCRGSEKSYMDLYQFLIIISVF